jgi:hypothetical protein
MNNIINDLKSNGYDYAIAIATESEIQNGAACGQLSLVIDLESSDKN